MPYHWDAGKIYFQRQVWNALPNLDFIITPNTLALIYTFKLSSVMWLTALPWKVERGEEGHCSVSVGREQAEEEAERAVLFSVGVPEKKRNV